MLASMKKPLLIVGDAVSSGTGLGRIAADLAIRIHENLSDVYRVASFGYGGPGSSKFPFPQYLQEGMGSDWLLPSIQQVWNDFAGEEKGIILCIWDVSRLGWFSQPKQSKLLDGHPHLRQFLLNPPFEKWLYTPVDAEGPNGRLTFPLMKALLGFDRIIAYGQFGERVIRDTISEEEADKRHLTGIPHGIDREIFYESQRSLCRKVFHSITGAQPLFGQVKPIEQDEVLVGIVATNQSRKDWSLGIRAFALLAQKRKARLWIHTDTMERNWSLPCLLIDYGIVDKSLISLGFLEDYRMAQAYSACDLTLGIGLGEGMGYPIHESLFCGTPCVHGDYAGAPEWMANPDLLVKPIAWYYEGMYACKRPVFDPRDWADRMEYLIGKRTNYNGEIEWTRLWKERWEPYLREAANV